MKQFFYIFLLTAALAACKKTNQQKQIAVELKGTDWGGKYYDINRPFDYKDYKIIFKAGGVFEFYSGANFFPGKWSSTGTMLKCKFDVGDENEWTATVDGTKMTGISPPAPDKFRFVNCVRL